MRALLLLASLVMLVSSEPEPPTSYSHRSTQPSSNSGSQVSYQAVPSVAQLHIPTGSSSSSSQYSAPQRSYGAPQQQSQSQGYSAPSSSYGAPQQQQQQQSQGYSAPQQSYGAPSSAPQQSYGAPSSQPQQSYGAPSSQPQQSYGAPATAASSYGAPSQGYSQGSSQSYGAPSQGYSQQQSQYHSQSQPANIQVSYGAPPQLPPGSSYGPPPVVTGAGPDHEIEYRVVYKPVKAPKPDLVLPPPPPKQKTIVYILVPRIEPPEPIIVPTHPPTPPSKPEVYFIRYKAPKKQKQQSQQYGAPAPSQQYGIGSAPKAVFVEAPSSSLSSNKIGNKKREIVRVTSSSSEVSDSSAEAILQSFGDRVKAQLAKKKETEE